MLTATLAPTPKRPETSVAAAGLPAVALWQSGSAQKLVGISVATGLTLLFGFAGGTLFSATLQNAGAMLSYLAVIFVLSTAAGYYLSGLLAPRQPTD
ncbi:MAG: hypothetical protein WDN03_10145 [Rhizomicrobium sp.]